MRKHKWLLASVILILAVLLAAGSTLAYFTAAEQQKRTYVVSGVHISMTEDFADGTQLLPGQANAVEKQVSITLEDGSADAYVWYEYRIPAALSHVLHVEGTLPDWAHTGPVGTVEKDGVRYDVYLSMYMTSLKGGQSTVPDEVDVYLDGQVGYDAQAQCYTCGEEKLESFEKGLTLQLQGYALQAKHLADADDDGDVDAYDAYALYHAQQAREETF